MPIRFVCPMCWAVRDSLDDALLGKTIKCQECHAMSVAEHTPAPNASSASKPAATRPAPVGGPGASLYPSPTSGPPVAARPPRVLFSSGDIPQPYEIIDLVFAHGNSTEGAMKGVQPVQAFQMLVSWLGQTAQQIGGNGVIHIRLDFRPLAAQGFLGSKQAFEVYGYGTAIRLAS